MLYNLPPLTYRYVTTLQPTFGVTVGWHSSRWFSQKCFGFCRSGIHVSITVLCLCPTCNEPHNGTQAPKWTTGGQMIPQFVAWRENPGGGTLVFYYIYLSWRPWLPFQSLLPYLNLSVFFPLLPAVSVIIKRSGKHHRCLLARIYRYCRWLLKGKSSYKDCNLTLFACGSAHFIDSSVPSADCSSFN